jgi:drug/metabolite transporter (DMT)-like permease
MDLFLYGLTVFLWGTSWITIKFQLGIVAPEVSVVYRFVISAALMLAFCLAVRRPMRFAPADHGFMALQGIFLFSTNYFLIYLGSQYLTTGLVAVVFSSIVVMNILGSAVLFRTPVSGKVAAGALLGLAGISLVFWPEVQAFDMAQQGVRGLVLSLFGTASASAGMLTSAWNQKRRGLPVIQTNAYGMVYGTLFITGLTLARGSAFTFDSSPAYVLSLLWLAVFATVLGFWSYLTLIGRIGADRAAYATVLFPVIALALSTAFEGYQWTTLAALGVALVLAGNALVLAKSKVAGRAPAAASPH